MITREDFDGLCDDLVERTLETVREVLTDQKLKPNDIAEVLLVGGSTRMPMVREALQKFFGRPATLAGNPDLVVALGVALCAQGHRDSMNPLGRNRSRSGAITYAAVAVIAGDGGSREGAG